MWRSPRHTESAILKSRMSISCELASIFLLHDFYIQNLNRIEASLIDFHFVVFVMPLRVTVFLQKVIESSLFMLWPCQNDMILNTSFSKSSQSEE